MDPNQEALDLLKEKRRVTEEPVEPTEGDEAETAEDEVEPEAEIESEEAETEESEDLTIEDDDEGPGYYLIDGEQVTQDQIKDWKNGALRQSDYSKKTMDLAEQRKVYEAKESALNAKEGVLTSLIEELEADISGQDGAIDWKDLAENDSAEYTLRRHELDERNKALAKAKNERDKLSKERIDRRTYEQQLKMRELLPQWFDGSQNQNNDLKLIGDYLEKNGFSNEEMNKITDARQWKIYLDAAKQQALVDKNPAVKKKLKNAPKLIKPSKARVRKAESSAVDDAKKRYHKSGRESDLLVYMKLKREQNVSTNE